MAFFFLELLFCFLEVPFYFSKMPCRFPELSFSFPVLPSFCLLCVSFSKNAFFTSWLYLLLLCLEICFAFILLPLGSLYWLTHHAFLITLKPLHGIWFFVFYINFSLHDSLEIPVSEHLQWLKFKKRNCELYLQTTGRAAQVDSATLQQWKNKVPLCKVPSMYLILPFFF